MSLVCGFNLFGQIKDVECGGDSTERLILLKGIEILDFSWSGILFREESVVKYRGFQDGRMGKTLDINTPNNDCILKGRCKGDELLVVTRGGDCWRLALGSGQWNQLVLRESNNIVDQDQSGVITDLAASDNITLLLNHLGEVFSYPSLVSSPGLKVTQVACGFEHSLFLCDNGCVYTWGSSSRGQLGHGDIESREEPVELSVLSGLNVVQIAAGGWHTCALIASGDLYSWGWNHHGQIALSYPDDGEVVSEPRLVEPPVDDAVISSVSCGTCHTVVILQDMSVYGCGSNKWGQLGGKKEEIASKTSGFKLLYKPESGVKINSVHAASWNTAIILSSASSSP